MAIPFYEPNSTEDDEIDGTFIPLIPESSEQSTATTATFGGDFEYAVETELISNLPGEPIDEWNATGNQIIVSLCQSLATAMAGVIKEHYDASVAAGQPFTTATVHVSPKGLQFAFKFDD